MSDFLKIFRKLSEFYDKNVLWEEVEEMYENAKSVEDDKGKSVLELPLVRRALQDEQVYSTLLEISAQIRSLRGESSVSYDNTFDCWDEVVKVSPRDHYLAFIYALAGLTTLNANSMEYTKLSLAAVNMYFLSLTIPGSKGFHIFEEDIINHCLQIFTLVERLQNADVVRQLPKQHAVQLWVGFTTFCDDLKLLLRYVHLADKQKTRDALLRRLIDIQYLNHERGYSNICK